MKILKQFWYNYI